VVGLAGDGESSSLLGRLRSGGDGQRQQNSQLRQ
jgi:hypothetical protein